VDPAELKGRTRAKHTHGKQVARMTCLEEICGYACISHDSDAETAYPVLEGNRRKLVEMREGTLVTTEDDTSQVVRDLLAMQEHIDTFVESRADANGIYRPILSETRLVEMFKAVVNAGRDAAISNARERVELVRLGLEYRRRMRI
jgi:hypothetical protein